jgi:5-hydroxyisourate hydrolase
MARLSTHILDTARGVPAAGVMIELHSIAPTGRVLLKSATTNTDGRTDDPLLPVLAVGIYELTFYAGDYLRQNGTVLPEPAFLDQVVIRFGIADTTANYHVPLLLSPFGYSTYRGS